MADDFLEFCTGRAWILTDVGITAGEPIYGFAHRTFLEYFAAEYLVRSHPRPEDIWAALRRHLVTGEWEVIAQIALHLLDRSFDRGADNFLRLALTDERSTPAEREHIRDFVCRALEEVPVAPDIAELIGDC